MPAYQLYSCTKCRKEFPFEKVKYDADHHLVCTDCFDRIKALENKEKLAAEKPDNNEPVHFICVSCRFKFNVKRGSDKALKCPYCGKTRLMHVKKYKDENDLISDSTDPRFDY